MNGADAYKIVDDATWRADDQELVGLLWRVYVGGGFTDADLASTAFTPEAIRARGHLLCARGAQGVLLGTVIVVPSESEARRIAAFGEAEMHLLAVDERYRGGGIGRGLVSAAVDFARRVGYRGMVLWTQPTMHVAHRVYQQAGFTRSPAEDFERGGRTFHVYRREL
jgi:GNAT superfamily N-acetyltransferase